MSWRRLEIILLHLPAESVYKTAVRNATDLTALPPPDLTKHGPWPQTDLLLAGIFDRLGQLMWMQSDGSQPPPKQYPRPGVDVSNVRPISPAAAAYMEYVRENRRHPPDDWRPATG